MGQFPLTPVLLSVPGRGTGNSQLVLLVLLFDFLQDVDFQPGSLSVLPNVLDDFQCHLGLASGREETRGWSQRDRTCVLSPRGEAHPGITCANKALPALHAAWAVANWQCQLVKGHCWPSLPRDTPDTALCDPRTTLGGSRALQQTQPKARGQTRGQKGTGVRCNHGGGERGQWRGALAD